MPNWTYNTLELTNEDNALLDKAAAGAQEGKLFNTLVPMPDETDHRSWAIDNWGTKWDVQCEEIERDGDTLSLVFDSAWSPPVNFYETLVEQGFGVEAYYLEPGMCFVGAFIDGEDECMEFDETLDNVPEEWVDRWNLSEMFDVDDDEII